MSNEFFQISDDSVAENIYLKLNGNYVVFSQGTKVRLGVISNRKEKFRLLVLQCHPLPQFPLVLRHPNLFIRKILKSTWSAYTVIILKRANESIFFKSYSLTAFKVKFEKEVADSLMSFNLLNMIHLFLGKKYLSI